MREYEVTVVIRPDLDEEALEQLLERVAGMLTHGDEETDKPIANHWGRRHLAYPINKYAEGYYVLYDAKLDPSRISDLERNMQYIDDVLRHLVVRAGQ